MTSTHLMHERQRFMRALDQYGIRDHGETNGTETGDVVVRDTGATVRSGCHDEENGHGGAHVWCMSGDGAVLLVQPGSPVEGTSSGDNPSDAEAVAVLSCTCPRVGTCNKSTNPRDNPSGAEVVAVLSCLCPRVGTHNEGTNPG
jgi:hypothetical protein